MLSRDSSFYSHSESNGSDENSIIEITPNDTNNSNNPYRGSLFFEETLDPSRIDPPRHLSIANRDSAHSFTVYLDDSRYEHTQTSSSSDEINATDSIKNNTTNETSNDIMHIPELINKNVNNIHHTKQNSVFQEPLHIMQQLQQQHSPNRNNNNSNNNSSSNSPLRLHHTTGSMSTGDTEYFEANQSIGGIDENDNDNDNNENNDNNNNNSNNNNNPQDVSLIQSSSSDLLDGYGDSQFRDDSTDSMDTQDTEILNSRIRNSQSSTSHIRDSIKTLSTIILTDNNKLSPSTTEMKRRSHLGSPLIESPILNTPTLKSPQLGSSMHESPQLTSSTIESLSPNRRLNVENRLFTVSSESISNHGSIDHSHLRPPPHHNNTNINNQQYHESQDNSIHLSTTQGNDNNRESIMEPSYSSLFQYDDYNETIEPDIEEAVELLTRDVNPSNPQINYVNPRDTRDISNSTHILMDINKQKEDESEDSDLYKDKISSGKSTETSEKFIPHELKIPRRLSISVPPSPIHNSETHIPRSPSLINKFLVTPSPKKDTHQHGQPQRKMSILNDVNVSPMFVGSISMKSQSPTMSHGTNHMIPKVQVLQSVSGPNRWKPNPMTKPHMVSMVGSNEFKSPIKKLSFHEESPNKRPLSHFQFEAGFLQDNGVSTTTTTSPINAIDGNIPDTTGTHLLSNTIPTTNTTNNNNNNNNNNIPKIVPNFRHSGDGINTDNIGTIRNSVTFDQTTNTVIHHEDLDMNHSPNMTRPLPIGVSNFKFNTTEIPMTSQHNNNNNDDDGNDTWSAQSSLSHVVPIQHIDNTSAESFDSQSYKFWDIYSWQRIMILIMIGLLIPPLFFMIYLGEICGINDYKLMKLVLNKEHRLGLFRGFVWDIDLHWLRRMSLIIGSLETLIIFACVAIGFGVGLTQ